MTRRSLILAIPALPASLCAQDLETRPKVTHARIESIIFRPETGILTWEMSEGAVDAEGKYTMQRLAEQYSIDAAAATMTVAGETRRFSDRERDALQQFLATLERYCGESTAWWEAGRGEPVGGHKEIAHGPTIPPDPWERS